MVGHYPPVVQLNFNSSVNSTNCILVTTRGRTEVKVTAKEKQTWRREDPFKGKIAVKPALLSLECTVDRLKVDLLIKELVKFDS